MLHDQNVLWTIKRLVYESVHTMYTILSFHFTHMSFHPLFQKVGIDPMSKLERSGFANVV